MIERGRELPASILCGDAMQRFVAATMALTTVALIGLATGIWLFGVDWLAPAPEPAPAVTLPAVTLKNWRLLRSGMPVAKFKATLGNLR